MTIVIALILGAIIGLALGMMGGGGSILTLPIFVYILGIEPKTAIVMSLAVVGITSLIGAIGHAHAGNLHARAAMLFAPTAMIMTWFGTKLASVMPGSWQLVLFASIMLLSATSMLRGAQVQAKHIETESVISIPGLLVIGALVGILTGVIGVGGGFLIVPALVLLAKLPIKKAIGTSLALIALNSLVGFIGSLGHVVLDWRLMTEFILSASLGILVGTQLVKYIEANTLKRSFGVFLVVIATFILYQNRTTFGFDRQAKSARHTTKQAPHRLVLGFETAQIRV